MSEKRAFSRLIKNVRARFRGYKNFVLDKVTEWKYIKYVKIFIRQVLRMRISRSVLG